MNKRLLFDFFFKNKKYEINRKKNTQQISNKF